MCLRYKILMQIRRLAIHDGLEHEKRNFILNPLSDREPVEIFENWSDVLIQENFVHAGVSGCSACSCQNIMNYNNQARELARVIAMDREIRFRMRLMSRM